MASWIKYPTANGNGYVNIATVNTAYVDVDSVSGDIGIVVLVETGTIKVKGGFTSIAAAQAALDNQIVNLGGSI